MRTKVHTLLISIILLGSCLPNVMGQASDTTWTLEKCIQYALKENIQIKQSALTNEINLVNASQSKQNRLPNLSANLNQNFSWSKQMEVSSYSSTTSNPITYGSLSGNTSSNYGLSSTVTLFNGFRISNTIRQSEINYEAGKYDLETTKESISLSILSAYLQVIYAEEQVKNDAKQVESTLQQLKLAEERFTLGVISRSDYLQVPSQLATEKQTLATDEGTLAINKLTLMQLLELPASNQFSIVNPEFGDPLQTSLPPKSDSIYSVALGIKPQVKSAQLNKDISGINVKLAKAGYLPSLSLSLGLSTSYGSSNNSNGYSFQLNNNISPTIGFSLSIPIYQNSQVRAKVDVAKINYNNAELNELSVKNQLRKSIEQASVDVSVARKEYEAGLDQLSAANESYQVALQKYQVGMINLADFIIQKTNQITAESKLLQSKYNLIFSYKTLNFYSGVALTL